MEQANAEKYTDGGVHIYKGVWRGMVSFINDEGIRKRRSKTFPEATGKREAQKALKVWKAQLEAEAIAEAQAEAIAAEKENPASPRQTVAQYVARSIEARSTSVERSTARGYRYLLENLIEPYIGSVPLDELTPDAVQSWVNVIGEKYTPGSVKKAFNVLKAAMTEATDRDVIPKDPTRTVKRPKLKAPKPNALDARGRHIVMEVMKQADMSPSMLGVKLALFTGMREGELCALKWKNVSFSKQTLTVAEAIGSDGTYYLKNPKTDKSRTLALPDEIVNDLKARKLEQQREAKEGAFRFTAEYFVLGGADGSFMAPHYISRKWRSLADALELKGTQGKRPTFHDLRHTFATMAISEGIDVKTVAGALGHANAAMTLNTYADIDPDAQRRGAEAVAAALNRNPMPDNVIACDFGTGTEG